MALSIGQGFRNIGSDNVVVVKVDDHIIRFCCIAMIHVWYVFVLNVLKTIVKRVLNHSETFLKR